MRAVLATLLGFAITGMIWAFYTPVSAYALVHAFSNPDTDVEACERALLRAGNGAILALRGGTRSSSPQVRLRCARLLALQGDRSGDRCMLEMLKAYGKDPKDPIGAMAEAFLLAAWEQREGPDADARRKLQAEGEFASDAEKLNALGENIQKNPKWAGGLVLRARLYQRNNSGLEARYDALEALKIEPDNFEAMVVLGGSYLMLNAADRAYLCFEQAVRINPRIRHFLKEDIQEVLKAIEIERARERREKRRETPIA
jgi:tetratricopeptide (TPR) repeat protein